MSIKGARGCQGKKHQDSLLQGSPHGHRARAPGATPKVAQHPAGERPVLSTQPSSVLPGPCLGQSDPQMCWEATRCNPRASGGRDGRTGAAHAANSPAVGEHGRWAEGA